MLQKGLFATLKASYRTMESEVWVVEGLLSLDADFTVKSLIIGKEWRSSFKRVQCRNSRGGTSAGNFPPGKGSSWACQSSI
jgi:hypothetical protein